MTRYQFQIDDEKWDDWKMTVPRDKSLETRIIELVEADTDGRVADPGVNLDDVKRSLDELEDAVESGDSTAVRDALEEAQEAISDGDPDDVE